MVYFSGKILIGHPVLTGFRLIKLFFTLRSQWVGEMKALMAAKDSGKPVLERSTTVCYRPEYIVRFVEASTGEELYGEPVDYAPGQEITKVQVSNLTFYK